MKKQDQIRVKEGWLAREIRAAIKAYDELPEWMKLADEIDRQMQRY